jgi:hypothetical protein
VLRRDAVHQPACLVEVPRADEGPALRQRSGNHLAPRQRGELACHAGGDRLNVARVGRDEDRLRQLVVLGLGEEIHRHPVGLRAAVTHHHDLRRAGDHVDADDAEHAPLGGRDIGVAGAHDLVHRRNRRGAVGERRDRLRSSDAEHAVHAADRGRREH